MIPSTQNVTGFDGGPTAPTDDVRALTTAEWGKDSQNTREDGVVHPLADAEAALVAKFMSWVQAPQFLIHLYREMESDRKYVSEDCMLLETQDTVAVNHVLRLQYTAMAHAGLTDIAPAIQPARKAGGFVDPQDAAFAETAEIVLDFWLKQMKISEQFEGAMQDASTNPWAILKVTLYEDFYKDPIGKPRFKDLTDKVARWEQFKRDYAMGRFSDGEPMYQEMRDLEKTVRTFIAGQIAEQVAAAQVELVPVTDPMTGAVVLVPNPMDPREQKRVAIIQGQEPVELRGLPELPHYRGFEITQILPEDFRWSWTDITRPEDMPASAWLAHRVYMSPDEVAAEFGIPKKDINGARLLDERGLYTQRNYLDEEPGRRNPDIESSQRNERVAVWEMWDRRSGRRYGFVHGMRRFVYNDVPQAVGKRWHPFFLLYYNRVTGQVLPLSDVKLLRSLQDEVNTIRTHDREARRAAYPTLFVGKNVLTDQEKDNYRNRRPFEVIEVERADELAKYLKETTPVPYNPSLFNTNLAVFDMQLMAGIPMAASGGTGSGVTATQDAIAQKGFEAGTNRRRTIAVRVIEDIMWYMLEIGLKVFPESYIKQVAGPMAVWPSVTTEELYTRLRVEIKGGMNGKPDRDKLMQTWTSFAGIAQSLGLPVNGPAVLRELLDAMDVRKDFREFIGFMPPPMGGTPMGGPPPAKPGEGAGPDGGAPPMMDRGGPGGPSLGNIPNSPYNQMGPAPGTPA
jgi:hypothetical protein